jgi:hypothetical protein
MAESDLTEIQGEITYLDQENNMAIRLVLKDTAGRLFSVIVEYGDMFVATGIFKSLGKGMKVSVQVEGPLVPVKASYRGVESISVIEHLQ